MLDLTTNNNLYEDFMTFIYAQTALHAALWFQLVQYSAARFLPNYLFFNKAITQFFISCVMAYASSYATETFIDDDKKRKTITQYPTQVLLPAIAVTYCIYYFMLKNKNLNMGNSSYNLVILSLLSMTGIAFHKFDSNNVNTRCNNTNITEATEDLKLLGPIYIYDSLRSFTQTFCAIALYAQFKGFELGTTTILKYSAYILAAKTALDLFNSYDNKRNSFFDKVKIKPVAVKDAYYKKTYIPNIFNSTNLTQGVVDTALHFL